jgi:hypothetical protein
MRWWGGEFVVIRAEVGGFGQGFLEIVPARPRNLCEQQPEGAPAPERETPKFEGRLPLIVYQPRREAKRNLTVTEFGASPAGLSGR